MRKHAPHSWPTVLIVHARGEWSGLPRIPRLCRAAGARVAIFAPPGCSLWKSAFVDDRFPAPKVEGAFSAALRAHLAEHQNDYAWVLVGDENAVVELSTRGTPDWLAGWFPVNPAGPAIDLLANKVAFTEAAVAAGVPMPASQACRTFTETVAAADQLGYPVMLKAARGYAGVGVRRAKSREELDRVFAMLADRVPLVVQNFEIGRVGSTQVFFDRGRLACWASSYKHHVFPEPFGPSSARELMVHPEMQSTLEKVGRLTGFHGLCGVDWLHRDADGKLLVLEFNPRPAPVIHLGPMSGVDFSIAIGDSLRGRFRQQPPIDVGPQRAYLFPQHLVRCIEMRKWRDLKYWIPFVSTHDVPWDQPRLLLSHLAMLSRRLTRALTASAKRAWEKLANRFWRRDKRDATSLPMQQFTPSPQPRAA